MTILNLIDSGERGIFYMDKEKWIKFVIDGMVEIKSKSNFRFDSISLLIAPLLATSAPLLEKHMAIDTLDVVSIIFLIFTLVLSIILFALSFFPHTVKSYLAKLSIFFLGLIIGLNMIQFTFYNRLFGINSGYLLFVIIPLVATLFAYDFSFKKASIIENNSKKSVAAISFLGVGAIAFGSKMVSKWMQQTFDRNTNLLILLILALLINSFLSIGLTWPTRLYVALKLEKEGVDLSQYDPLKDKMKKRNKKQ